MFISIYLFLMIKSIINSRVNFSAKIKYPIYDIDKGRYK